MKSAQEEHFKKGKCMHTHKQYMCKNTYLIIEHY